MAQLGLSIFGSPHPSVGDLEHANGQPNTPKEMKERRNVIRSALEQLNPMRGEAKPRINSVYEHVAEHYRARLAAACGDGPESERSNRQDHEPLSRDHL